MLMLCLATGQQVYTLSVEDYDDAPSFCRDLS